MVKLNSILNEIGIKAKESASEFLKYESSSRNRALLNISEQLLDRKSEILDANNSDVENAISSGLSPSLIGRMKLDESSIQKISEDMIRISELKESVGIEFDQKLLPNGLILLSSYHPSPRNVNTKLVSNKMMVDLFKRAKKLAKF